MKPRSEFKQLVAANRILAHEQVVDAFGHVSLRHPDHRHHYVLSRSRAPELVELDDLMKSNWMANQLMDKVVHPTASGLFTAQ